jgi:hypothetical protein
MMRAELVDGFAPILGFRYESHIRLNCDESGDSLADEGMIVDGENTDRSGIATHSSLFVILPESLSANQERLAATDAA